ncbi:hypothetical protein [Streptosporangium sp. CA-115845]|uniref:hypothetical protein n=1 Tax=Streptosporangium sp. CA-115845 TaxID=3240071 RepID=UPI003D9014FC
MATGFAGALFDPGGRSLLAVAAADRRVRAFGWFNMAGQTGLLLGPLAGLAVMGPAFVPLVAWPGPVPHVAVADEGLAGQSAMAPMLVAAALLALGTMLICPFEMEVIVAMSGGRLVATHYGLYATLSGIGVTAGSVLTGTLWDAAGRWGLAWLPWTILVVIGWGCALAMTLLDRRRLLTPSGAKGEPALIER